MTPRYAPYGDGAASDIYHLLFCDDAAAFAPCGEAAPAPWQDVLYAASPSPNAVRAIAVDDTTDARVRALACNWLVAHGAPPPSKSLLGTIVEVPLDDGLDTLAAYVDGSVRYINHTGRMSIFEGRNAALAASADALLDASRVVIARIGPWDKPRLPPPARGHVRLTFLVTDGLYFGEGPMNVLQRDGMAGPVIHAAGMLLRNVVDVATA